MKKQSKTTCAPKPRTSEPRFSDFRSDTVTRPTPAMRLAMVEAPVGDDGFGDDPTVKELESVAAGMVGKERALFMPSGTMGNQVAVCCHAGAGDEILVEERGHISWFEAGGAAVLARAQTRTYALRDRRLDPADADRLRRLDIPDCPRLRLLCVEDTLNMHGGVAWPLDNLRELKSWAESHGMAVHMDGARLFNAAVATGVPAAELADCADSVMFCLSKGLGAPIGSMLCGPEPFVREARRWRKRLGGQLRQVGILAAAGLHALREHVDRLEDDHRLAADVAQQLRARVPALELAQDAVETNILIYRLPAGRAAPDLVRALAGDGVLVTAFPGNAIRLVTHLDVGPDDAERLVAALERHLPS